MYGIFHHEGYKKKFANALSKDLPRIPMAPDFAKISKAGRDLAKLHLNYETGPRHKLKKKAKFGDLEKIAFSRAKKGGKLMQDKTKLKVNGVEAFEIPEIRYRVNGRTPIEWAADRYKVSQDKESGIINDPCQGMTEQKTTEFIERLVHVGVESDRIIAEISRLPFEPTNWRPKKAGMDAFVGQTPSSPAQTKFA